MLLHQLNIFVKVAEAKSFSKAAESIYLNQSTVSTHISNLEKHYGQKLFDRLGKEVVLTHVGEKLYPMAKEMLFLQERTTQSLIDSAWKIEGHVRIAASSVPAQYVVPKFISKFNNQHPDVKFSLDLLDSSHVAARLIHGEADLGILSHQYSNDQLEYIPLLDEKLVVITPPDIQFPSGFSLDYLYKYPVLFRKAGSGTQVAVEKILKSAKIEAAMLSVVGYFDSVQVIKQCVREGMGISIISEIAAKDDAELHLINSYELQKVHEKRTFYLAYKTSRTQSPAVKEFIRSFLS